MYGTGAGLRAGQLCAWQWRQLKAGWLQSNEELLCGAGRRWTLCSSSGVQSDCFWPAKKWEVVGRGWAPRW